MRGQAAGQGAPGEDEAPTHPHRPDSRNRISTLPLAGLSVEVERRTRQRGQTYRAHRCPPEGHRASLTGKSEPGRWVPGKSRSLAGLRIERRERPPYALLARPRRFSTRDTVTGFQVPPPGAAIELRRAPQQLSEGSCRRARRGWAAARRQAPQPRPCLHRRAPGR